MTHNTHSIGQLIEHSVLKEQQCLAYLTFDWSADCTQVQQCLTYLSRPILFAAAALARPQHVLAQANPH